MLPISRVQRDVDVQLLEHPRARKISGWLAAHLGRLPRVGDEVPVTGGTIKVERVVNHRADRIRVVVDDPTLSKGTESPL